MGVHIATQYMLGVAQAPKMGLTTKETDSMGGPLFLLQPIMIQGHIHHFLQSSHQLQMEEFILSQMIRPIIRLLALIH
ncbi:MAG: hypothetical protein D6710_01885 [Nitrospirae bacterium]|nr:MAG: hypothetical protein D6710_01885 [Nitrospirota bacterium]